MQLTLDIDKAIQERDKGIEKAETSANRKSPGWTDRAYEMFEDWLSGWPSGYKFMMEHFRQVAKIRGLDDPPSPRSFGGIAIRAKIAGLIKSNDKKATTGVTAHRCYANEWEKI